MASRFIEITDFDEALKYTEAGLLVAKAGDEYYYFRQPENERGWRLRAGTYGILVEEDTANSE